MYNFEPSQTQYVHRTPQSLAAPHLAVLIYTFISPPHPFPIPLAIKNQPQPGIPTPPAH
ncbi:uncharacterized protein K444DRAFT_120120 [Hyaloscypha bicolor E]|uniref:Uncharacterized protein n=1 Tax=Hyaloscypha bicolor E TaxID=1095630 RepID=A0A2J6TU41_9HELO|nr:uncharacterized protein K444DRAFT_120120 [Hyaloscypha bicolor E]PMD66535.1 hypothetical protein K444DRAFT_120120 [Hyaloscypha bicolor E]